MKKLLPAFAFLWFALYSNAQGRYDSAAIEQRFKRIEHITNILKDFRFKAFIQAEWQKADTAGINTVQGQNFPAAANNRFLLRQGRFILGWEHEIVNKHGDTIKIGQFAFNENLTERGFSGLYEFYGRIFDPWTGWFSLRGGVFTTPFGFETPVYVDVQESPEQSRVNSNIFPMESNLGGEIMIESPRTFKPFYLRVDAGVLNGDGILVNSETGAYQNRKDFIGRVWFGKFWNLGGGTRFGFNASVSYYNGGVMQTTDNVFEVGQNAAGEPVFENVTLGTPDTAWKTHVFEYHRDYYGGHLELNLDYKLHGTSSASTMLRGELIAGTQPSQATSDQAPTPVGTAVPAVDLYLRKFAGGAFYFTEGFHYYAGKQLMNTDITFKCDIYDPNTQVSGAQLTTAGHFSPLADMKWTTFSGGITFAPVQYFKLVLWYDHVTNENTGFAGIYTTDYKKDDVFTIRTQFSIDSWWWDKKTNNQNLIAKQY